jgi:hypothetical protein
VTPDDLVRRRARQLAAQAAASGDPAGWFETLYAEARAGQAVVPWDDGRPNPHLTVEQFRDAEDPPKLRWRAQFTRR